MEIVVNDVFDSYLLSEADLSKGFRRLLDTDRHLVVPSLSPLRFLISSIDVLHSFSLPSIGIKIDAVTGRLNMVSFFLITDGILLGQCSELCGAGHATMPIVVESIEYDDYHAFLEFSY